MGAMLAVKEKLSALVKSRKLGAKFYSFMFIGFVWSIISVVLMWLLIDVLSFAGWLGSGIIVTIALFGKYFHYTYIGLMRHKFVKFIAINASYSLFVVLFMGLAVDVFSFPAKYASPVIIGFVFIFKFLTFEMLHMFR
jgi:predicted neutral ceramidase superfamily lipid hydrolase